jgi:hypothetical protein
MGKTNFSFDTLPCNPLAIFGRWLHIKVPKKYMKDEFINHFEQKFTTCLLRVGI